MKDKIERYESLKLQIKLLEASAKEINTEITEYMVKEGADETEELPMGGKIKLSYKSNWSYPQDVEGMKEDLKEQEKKAQLDGRAIETKNPFITYNSPKG